MTIRSSPRMEIILNATAARSAGVGFPVAFHMMVRGVMNNHKCSPRPILCLAALLLAGPGFGIEASAQSLDYGIYEQLFAEPVTESATGMPQRASDAPANIEIITQDDIRRSGAVTIPHALQFVSGVDVRTYGIVDQEVGIRGYNQAFNPRLLVLVNGRQVYSDDYGHVNWPSIPVQLA